MKLRVDWRQLWHQLHPKLEFRATSFQSLKAAGILGMNARNYGYIHNYNDRKNYPKVDDKIQTKMLAQKAHLPVPALLGLVRFQHEVRRARSILMQQSGFVVKPSRGSAGKGILVITHKESDVFYKSSGVGLTWDDIQRHISNILSGLYSLGGVNDTAMIEELIEFTDSFDRYSYQGVPDVRIIVFKGYPVMAMSRLSTRNSDGKANLHQGAVGVGIDLGSGRARFAVQFDRRVVQHPDTGSHFASFHIPQWHRHLTIATQCYELTGLGYLGVDIVLDKNKGPQILELNARPGLAIQIANGDGLLRRLQKIESLPETDPPPGAQERVLIAKSLFSDAAEPDGEGV
jgi:alpha-L-glutamate ligase-like protein